MASEATEKDHSERVVRMHALAAAPAEMCTGPCGMVRAGCTVNCLRFAGQCGSMDRQAPATVVSVRIRV